MGMTRKCSYLGRASSPRIGRQRECCRSIGQRKGTSRNTTGQATFLFDRQLTTPWDAFVEYAGDFPQHGGPEHILHFDTAYKVTPHQQLDFHFGVGLSRWAGSFYRVRLFVPPLIARDRCST
jgi:hypothetical protein